MEYIILSLLIIIAFRFYRPRWKIKLSSPIFRNTETKELGCWASYNTTIPFPPFVGLIVTDGSGGVYKIRQVTWDKGNGISCDTYYDQAVCENEDDYEHAKRTARDFGWKLREVPSGKILHWWKDEYEV